MSKVMLIGCYDGGLATLCVDSSLPDVESTKETIKNVVRNYLITIRNEEGWDMPYSYNFGDIIDECFQNLELQPQFEAAGIKVLSQNDVVVDVFDHDEIWIYDDEVNE